MTPSSTVTHEGDTLPRPLAEHGTSIALGRPFVHPDQGDDEPRGEPDARTASPHDQPSPQSALNGLTDSLASTNLVDSSPPLPPLPATSSSYPLLPDIPSSPSARVPSVAPASADDEVEALVDPSESAARPGTRKSSLTPSEEALILPGVRNGATTTARRRPSVDGQSVASGASGRSVQSGGHSFATAKNYFPLVQKRSTASGATPTAAASSAAGDPWGAPASPSGAWASPAGTPAPETPPPLRQARRRPSGSSSLASSTRPTSVFPTIKPSRSASSSVFPLRSPPPSSSTAAADSPSACSSDAGSLCSESLLGAPASPPPSIPARPTPSPARSGTSPSLFSLSRPDSSLYAPSLAPSRRSNETTATSTLRRALAKPSYASSRAPSHAEAFLASAPEPLAGPPSIFLNPMPQARSVKELVPNPKRRLSAFFGAAKAKAASAPSPSSASSTAAAGPSRGKSASILDAALASSATWAAHRGEQWRAPASSSSASPSGDGAGFGAPAGYRPAHQVRRQQEEAAARLAAERVGAGEGGAASPGGPTMGGGGEVPVSGEAIAEAFTRNQGRDALAVSGGGGGSGGIGGGRAGGAREGEGEGAGGGRGAGLERTRSGVSMASVAGIDEPANARGGGAFPVRKEAFPTRARAQGGSVRE